MAATKESPNEWGWKCPYTEKVYQDHELTGYGNPPRSPNAPVGTGAGAPMTRVKLTKTESK